MHNLDFMASTILEMSKNELEVFCEAISSENKKLKKTRKEDKNHVK